MHELECHCWRANDRNARLQEGVAEFFANARPELEGWKDGWTAVTADGKWTAQAEHTLLITEGGVEILTASPAKAAAAAAAAK